MARPRIIRQIEVLEDKGVFGACSCGGDVRFYSDSGVKCSVCGKLYGLWYIRRKVKTEVAESKELKFRQPEDLV
ncbi:MAG: hypothetical protein HY619_07545 [Thaumarchaeota archaeon]|nr:hypothetical protein [Nitrososphaerota archaeon]